MDELERLKLDEEFIGLYDAAKDQKMLENSARIEGIEEGKKLGQNAKALEIAKSFLSQNIDINIIAISTGLSQEQISNL